MKLLTKAIREKMLKNGEELAAYNRGETEVSPSFFPVVKLFTPDASCTWLLTDLDPEETDIAFGLCDLGMGFPELGSVRISEIAALRGKLGLPVERDMYFTADKTISEYADDARNTRCIQV